MSEREDPEKKKGAIVPPDEEPHEVEVVHGDVLGTTALAALNRSEIDVQIQTAKRFPRNITTFKRQALMMATLDEETAESMFYALPRSGKTIEGPSVRLAEVVGSAWGNIRYGARVIDVGDAFVTAQGAAFDLENNLACTVEVKRRITDRQGRRYNDDMIGVTSNAACSVALRQAIFKVVPFAYVKSIYEEAKLTAIGKSMTMEQRRTRALGWYTKVGGQEKQVLELLGRVSVEDITIDDLTLLQGLKTAITDGEATFADALAAKTGAAAPATPSGMPQRKSTTVGAADVAEKAGVVASVPPGTTETPAEDIFPDPKEAAAITEEAKASVGTTAPSPTPTPAPAPAPRASDALRVTKSASVSLPKGKGGGTLYEITFSDGKVRTSKDVALYRAAAAAEEGEYAVVCVFEGDVVKLISKAKK
jgi:hypothetical protein